MPSKKEISDAILFRLAGGFPDSGFSVDERQVWDSMNHKINAMLGMEHFSINLPSGETIPNNLFLATYEDVTVTRASNERSKCTLPAMPVSLPRNCGINEIRPVLNVTTTAEKMLGNPIIPLVSGQSFLLKADTLLNDMLGQFSYEVNGKTVFFSKDLTTFSITKVDIKLVLIDISDYSITTELPLPADMVARLQDDLFAQFSQVVPEQGVVNNFTNANQKEGGGK